MPPSLSTPKVNWSKRKEKVEQRIDVIRSFMKKEKDETAKFYLKCLCAQGRCLVIRCEMFEVMEMNFTYIDSPSEKFYKKFFDITEGILL